MAVSLKNLIKIGLVLVLFAALATVFPVARAILGFIYLTFIPGAILLRMLKLRRLVTIEKILFSAGLSIAFLMFVGLLMNFLYPLVGISKPLSTLPLTVTITALLIMLFAIGYYIDKGFSFEISLKELPLSSMLLLCLPLFGIIGAISAGINGNNHILILMITTISSLVILSTFSKKYISPKLYPVALFFIAIALLFHVSWISMYLYGFDIHWEQYFFELTNNNFRWDATTPSRFNAMLSVTLLPTIYAQILNLRADWVFKIVYPIIFSFVPLMLYQIYEKQRIGKLGAFLSVFFFVSNFIFYNEMLGLARQMIAEFFFVLLIFLLLDKKLDLAKNSLLFIIFSGALVMSHYALSYIFLFLIVGILVFSHLAKNRTRNLNLVSVLIFVTLVLSWYTYISVSTPIESIWYTFTRMIGGVYYDFFSPETRDQSLLINIGMGGPAASLGHEIGRVVFYATEFLVVIGVIKLIVERKKTNFTQEYIQTSLVSVLLLLMSAVIPYFASALNMTRIYHISLFILAPMCFFGGKAIFRIVAGRKHFVPKLVMPLFTLTILMPYFLFNVGVIYEVTGDVASSKSLSMHRIDKAILYDAYTSEQEVFSAKWFSKRIDNTSMVYCDLMASFHVLNSYALFPLERTFVISNNTKIGEGYVYLRTLNVVDGKMRGPRQGDLWNITGFSPQLNLMNKIYSNGGSNIYVSLNTTR